ncbi:ECF RNA polymerase sigma factor SigD [Botrimarina colliarenosi]|uniref:ECF RNA polymerase sigma factor SigD n=1 Tax=Botrimarina colliarenosi TaxID=2528001 RepID=A0A5C6AIN4_9BACT|nr:sigma-70 family RNA polymerase sigma factor [Botrimarina colliarenosi]TWT99874.1 ECF RNA polymerase sigma factor SigD [Botrimarina colliarenosi]
MPDRCVDTNDAAPSPESLLVVEIRRGKPDAWRRLIDEFEGRLLAFVRSRLGYGRSAASEDVVQETFIGFLTSLPNYDARRPLEGWLFSIAAHKLTDHLRREGRRPAVTLSSTDGDGSDDGGAWDLPGSDRKASTIARSGERRALEAEALAEALAEQVAIWRDRDDWPKIKAMELLFVRGMGNKEVAEAVGLTEQQVANFKFDFLANLKKRLKKQGLDEGVFPELV